MTITMEEALGIKRPEPKVEASPAEEELEVEYSLAELKKSSGTK